jgi:hypothetical protein
MLVQLLGQLLKGREGRCRVTLLLAREAGEPTLDAAAAFTTLLMRLLLGQHGATAALPSPLSSSRCCWAASSCEAELGAASVPVGAAIAVAVANALGCGLAMLLLLSLP